MGGKMKIKTTELTGPALDWAVAKALGNVVWVKPLIQAINDLTSRVFLGDPENVEPEEFYPSTYWSQGGPIIAREGIDLWRDIGEYLTETKFVNGVETVVPGSSGDGKLHYTWFANNRFGSPTPLIAAMRCFVASKFGDEVDIPEELYEA